MDSLINTDPEIIKRNLVEHITHPVLWTSMVHNMVNAGVDTYFEVGTDDTLQKIVARMYPDKDVSSLLDIHSYNGKIINYSSHLNC